ncbi:MAG: hypothetical protein V7751_06370 [Pseudoalteromonas distincta]
MTKKKKSVRLASMLCRRVVPLWQHLVIDADPECVKNICFDLNERAAE